MPNGNIPFDRSISAKPEDVQAVTPLIRRVIANNGGPFTFTGTCSYIVGHRRVAIVDPGPVDARHLEALLGAVKGETVTHILVTHTHRDHSTGAAALKQATGATIAGCRPQADDGEDGRHPTLDAAFDTRYRPDLVLAEGDTLEGPGFTLVPVETPGHTANHLAFALPEERALLSGDHVMAWSTTVIAPPGGSMRAYMASLRKLLVREDTIYWPGHGGPVRNPPAFVKALIVHRQWREAAILRRLDAGDATVGVIVSHLYRDLAPALRGGAEMSVLAHLQDLVERGLVAAGGPVSLRTPYAPV